MDMTNLQNQMGYVTHEDLFNRMVRHRPANGFYILKKIKDSDFIEVRTPEKRLFEIYVGRSPIYLFVRETIETVAKSLACALRVET